MTEKERRTRRRAAISCSLCRKRKIRCNRETPCNNCLRSKDAKCVYDASNNERLAQSSQETIARRSSTIPSPATTASLSATVPTPSSHVDSVYTTNIKEPEGPLSESRRNAPSVPSPFPTLNQSPFQSSLGGTFHVHESSAFGKTQAIIKGVTHKARTFGQSHWINGALMIRDIIDMLEPHVRDHGSVIAADLKKCKHLARVIKARRAPAWPSPLTENLPSKGIADDLVHRYLDTSETVYRILHIPSFRRDYETIWMPNPETNPIFLIQLKLVLAIGAAMYDDHFSLRPSAIKWIYEAQSWVSEPRFKSMLSLQYIQIHLLLLLAREAADVSSEMVWLSVGTLYRMAIQIGLHRDPALLPKSTIFIAEMRRRLWNTILELSVQSSLTSGGPPLTSFDDFDTESLGNFDDDQLIEENPAARPEEIFTQVSVAIALRKTLPLRLAVTRLLNDVGSHNTYEATLGHDAELRASYKTLCRTLQKYNSNDPNFSSYAMRMVDIIMHRYISALHIPFFGAAFSETAYAFSRKVAIESSLKIWYTAFPAAYSTAITPHASFLPSDRDNLARLIVSTSGFLRTVVFQATFTIAIELKSQLQEDEGLGPVSARPDLLAAVEGAKVWSFRCVGAGETSTKGYLFMCVISALIDGLIHATGKQELQESLVKAAEGAGKRCLPILEAAAAQLQGEESTEQSDTVATNAPLDTREDWDFMRSDSMFNDNMDPMSWTFSDDLLQEASFW